MAFQKKAVKKREYVNFKDNIGSSVTIEKGEAWFKNGKYESVGISVIVDDSTCLSDWLRMLRLENVELAIEENDKGYPVLVIRGKGADVPF